MFIECNGVKLYYEVSGQGEPIILIHGCTETHGIFDRLIPQLAVDHTVYAVDTRSHGKSQKVKRLHYTDMTADYAEFIKKLEIERPTVFGFSDGGIISIMLASGYPGLIAKAIAAGPNLNPEGNRPKVQKIFKRMYFFTRSKFFKLMITEPDIKPEDLAKIDIPFHILGGERDLIRTEHMQEIADSIKGATFELIPGATHGGYVVYNPQLYDIIKKYL